MKPTSVFAALILSVCIYFCCFLFVIHKPLTVGVQKSYYQKKLGLLKNASGKKLILLAGSNGRFSHRCETLEPELGIACINMSISADISLDYQLDKIKPFLSSGDIVYLPLEYGAMSGSRKDMSSGAELPFIMAYDHGYLPSMDWDRKLHALFYCDLKYLIAGLGEMLLERAGVQRRFGVDTLTVHGDESGHNQERAASYRNYIDSLSWSPPTLERVDPESYRAGIVTGFLAWAKQRDIVVIGGLPTTFDDQPISEQLVDRILQIYKNNGQEFVLLSGNSQYPRNCFYDTSYHLCEEFQIIHSQKLAIALKAFVD